QMVATPGQGKFGKAGDKFWKAVRARTGMQVMFLNVTNTLQQFTGLTIAAVKVKPRYLRNALWALMKSPFDSAEAIGEKSAFMKARMSNQMSDVQGNIEELILEPTKFETLRKFSQKNAYALQSMTQNIVDTMVWTGAYNQALEAGSTDKDAIRIANDAVIETQGGMNPEDISRFEASGSFARAFSMFYSYFNMQYNLLSSEAIKVTQADLGLLPTASRLFFIYAAGFMMPAVLSEMLVKTMSGSFDDDDDDEYMDDFTSAFFWSQFRSGTALFPVVGPVVSATVNSANDKWYDDKITTSPIISMAESATVGNAKNMLAIMDGRDVSGKKVIRDALTAVGMLSGIPAAALSRPLGYLSDVSEGNTEPANPVDFARGVLTGKAPKK
ncbi:MAG: hypothetical protein H0X02_05835, partial [Nitrosomonas sp.]|nr:hypothetical protein [Nitrosomonas sp.]